MKVSAYPSGQGPSTTTSFPFDYLYKTSPYKPDFFPIHVYSFAAASTPPQRVVDSTWQYSGRFIDWDGSVKTVGDVLSGWGAPGQNVGITEFNYDGGTQYASADSMWDAVYYASVMANAANGGVDLTTFWEMFAGSNTDELIADVYNDPPARLRSQALAMRLLKRLAVPGNKVLTSNVTSADNAVAYDWEGVAGVPRDGGRQTGRVPGDERRLHVSRAAGEQERDELTSDHPRTAGTHQPERDHRDLLDASATGCELGLSGEPGVQRRQSDGRSTGDEHDPGDSRHRRQHATAPTATGW